MIIRNFFQNLNIGEFHTQSFGISNCIPLPNSPGDFDEGINIDDSVIIAAAGTSLQDYFYNCLIKSRGLTFVPLWIPVL